MSKLRDSQELDCIQLPVPTPWPMAAAFAMVLIFAGLVTSLAVSFTGLLCAIVAFVGWFLDVFPHPQHGAVELKPLEERAAPVLMTERTISYLQGGSYRVHVPVHVHSYSSGILGGISGGIAMAIVALTFGCLEGSVWYPINLVATAGLPNLGAMDKEGLKQFHFWALLVGFIVHVSFSVLVGLLYVALLPTLPAKFGWLWGSIAAPLIWTSLVYSFLSAINPALAAHVSWPWFILSQVMFGLVAGIVVYRTARISIMQTWSLVDRMGVGGMRKR
ncbi:hypothetical protein AMD24_00177 [Candidatus Xiphinematobacter sp. Idaho Grape]|uniref:hypothetical protein n=1 Tax=Candidatus Xiphinematobacter sp. Idaho Grape TaxID=1704307 RepID=UPI0007060D32|nr:hypothetical protein [Candidatus Xiphinematobacter sp. Idaho Grape]ALJ56370.1 hypothetical protein AMD24_00177 [Candidatus Xiphinematobacter sp. Idaho Grape]